MSSSTPTPRRGSRHKTTRVPTRACANQDREQTAEIASSQRSVHVETITQPHESTRQEEYHDQ